MATDETFERGCDALDVFALWLCSAQVGGMPVTDLLADAPRAKPDPDAPEDTF